MAFLRVHLQVALFESLPKRCRIGKFHALKQCFYDKERIDNRSYILTMTLGSSQQGFTATITGSCFHHVNAALSCDRRRLGRDFPTLATMMKQQ